MKKMIATAAAALLATATIVGCAPKETVFEANTPAGDVEVERDVLTDDVTVEVERE